ncbi:MAG: tetratricopeptide repeat protein [Planctomycetota bacterium]
MRRPPASRTALVLLASAAASAAAAAPAARLQASPDFTLVLPHVEPDSVGVDLQLYDPVAREWRKWGEFGLERPAGATTGGRMVFRAPREGEYALRAAARDEVGNTREGGGPETADLVAVFDRTRPEVRVTSPGAGAAFEPGAEVRLAWRTTEAHPLARGAAAVEISADGGRTWRVVARRTDDTDEFRLAAPEAEGRYLLRVTVVDACGNRGRAASPEFGVRERPPAAPPAPVAVTPAPAAPVRQPRGTDPRETRPLAPREIEVAAVPERPRRDVPVMQPVARAVAEPAARPVMRPVTKPVTQPVAKPATQPVVRPAAQPVTKPAARPAPAPAVPAAPMRPRAVDVDPARRAVAREGHAKGARALAAGRLDEAAAALRDAVAADPSREGAWLDLSAALARSAKLKEALAVLERAEARFPKSPDLPLNRGLVLVRLSRAGEARTALERAVKLKPSSAEAHWTLGLIAVNEEELDRARGHWRSVVKWTPTCSALHKRARQLLSESE